MAATTKTSLTEKAKQVDIAYWRAQIKEKKDKMELKKQEVLIDKIDALRYILEMTLEKDDVDFDDDGEEVSPSGSKKDLFDERELKRIKQKMMLLIDQL